jgi:transcriptional regulator with XRE-family HTH domain
MKDLAYKAEVSYQKLCRLEFSNTLPRHPQEFLINIAHALGVHPDRLLVKANLTPLLSPRSDAQALPKTRSIEMTLLVDEDERQQLENYLQFLRNVRIAESISQEAEKDAEV